MTAELILVKKAIRQNELPTPQIEIDIQNKKMSTDFRILDVGSTKKKNIYVCENSTLTYRWMSEKEEKQLREMGKTFVTDF